MNTIDLLVYILSQFHITNWTISMNGVAKGPVTDAKLGIQNITDFWSTMKFEVDGVAHTLEGGRPLYGGASTISLDGVVMPNAHLAISNHIQGLPPHLKVEIDFDLAGTTYRFDGRVF